MNARALGDLHGLTGAGDVAGDGAGETSDDRLLGALGDFVDAFKVALAGDRETGLDDVDAHLLQNFSDFELLFQGHGGAGALLAVAQGGVENQNLVFCSRRISHWKLSFARGRDSSKEPCRQ